MKLMTFQTGPRQKRIGALAPDGQIVDLNFAYALYLRDVEQDPAAYRVADARVPADMRGLFEGGDQSLDAARAALKHAIDSGPRATGPSGERIFFRSKDVKLKAPISPKKFFHT